jgi:hypothetical protein
VLGNCEYLFPLLVPVLLDLTGLIELFSIELTNSVYIWGNEGNELDRSPWARWIGRIMAIRAAAKDKVFM